jgi:A/G-specific adenine glycosylase
MQTEIGYIKKIRKYLIGWYQRHHRKLPWRETDCPYCIWVSEVMLQQTQVNTVIPYYIRFLKEFPTVKRLAAAELQAVLKAWEGLGYYARARNLHRAAQEVTRDFRGVIPEDAEVFRKLPGVGEYIASAVMSIAFNRPHAVVDGNVKRVLSRLFVIEEPVNKPSSYRLFKDIAQKLLVSQDPGTFNQAVMELGAVVCKPQNPICDRCPLLAGCMAFGLNETTLYPKRLKKKAVPTHHLAVGVIHKNGRVLITKRKPDGLLGGLWEFPGGEIKKDQTPEAACVDRLKEAVSLTVEIQAYLTRVKHAYTHFKIVMDVFSCRYVAGRVRLNSAADFQWIHLKDIDTYPFHKANHKFFKLLKFKT